MIRTLLTLLFPAVKLAQGLPVAAATIGAAAIGAVGSNMAASTAASAQQSAAANSNSPWSQAQPYLESGYGQAQTALNNSLNMGTDATYTGERVAALNPYQTQGANSTAAYANGNGVNTANQLYGVGSQLTAQGAQFGGNAQSMVNQAGVNSNQNLQSFENAGNNLAQSSTTQNMINAADLSASQNLNETTLPSLLMQGEGQGGNDNTRTGVAMGVATGQAQANMLANASNIQGQMFNTGMSAAQNQYNTQQTQELNANNQVGQAGQMGAQDLLNGQEANGNNFDQLEASGGVFQGQQQNLDNAAMTQFSQEQQNPLNLIGQYQGIINGSYGGQPVSSVGPSVAAGTLQGLAGGALQGYGASTMLGGYNSGGAGTNQYGFSSGVTNPSATSAAGYAYTDPSYGLSATGY
jgi:hypothetical protein